MLCLPMSLFARGQQERLILNILHLRYADLNLLLALPSYQSYFPFYSFNILLSLSCILLFVLVPKRVGEGWRPLFPIRPCGAVQGEMS